MPNRPIQHELEDLSRIKFQANLPRNWVFRDKDKDYGVDGEVELFNQAGKATGFIFYVQLKATSSKEESKIFSVDFKIQTLEYYSNLEIPVLLVRYSEYLDKIYVKWVNRVDLSFVKKGAKTRRVIVGQYDEWNIKKIKKIENDLLNIRILKSGRFNLPISYSIQVNKQNVLDISDEVFKVKLRNHLNEYPSTIEYKRIDDNDLIKVIITKNGVIICLGILSYFYIYNLDKRSEESFYGDLSKDILLGISFCMVMAGQLDYCGKVIFDNNLQKHLISKEEYLIKMIPYLIHSSYLKELLQIVDEIFIVNEKQITLIPALTGILIQANTKNENKIKLIESFFKSQLDKSKNLGISGLISTAHYNLGNFYKSKNKYIPAMRNYVLAKRNDSSYLTRPYFYRDIAGICFEIKKFYLASLFYNKALKLGDSVNVKPLLADSLMFSGKYAEANKIFSEYISEVENPIDSFLLQSILLNFCIKKTNIAYQKRNPEKAMKLASIAGIRSRKAIKNINKALEEDLLSCLAWYNLGITLEKQNKFDDAMYCFATCAIIDHYDIQAWVNAFITFMNSRKEDNILIVILILKTAYHYNQDSFLIKLYETINAKGESNNIIIDFVEDILTENLEEKNNNITIRILSDDKYKELLF